MRNRVTIMSLTVAFALLIYTWIAGGVTVRSASGKLAQKAVQVMPGGVEQKLPLDFDENQHRVPEALKGLVGSQVKSSAPFDNSTLQGAYAFFTSGGTGSCSSVVYAGSMNSTIGFMTFDGRGNFTADYISSLTGVFGLFTVTGGSNCSPSSGSTRRMASGTYSVDSTGVVSFSTFASVGVIVDGGSGFILSTATGSSTGGGYARKLQ